VLIRDLLLDQIPGLTTEAQVRFQPPDATLRTDVANLDRMVLDVYLVELRDNRRLRSNERTRTLDQGFVFTEQAPERIDCHYLISAWSPAQLAPGIEPTLDEHALLYDAAAALIRTATLTPSRLYPAASAKLAAWPERFRDDEMPATVLPIEGFPKLSEFWTTMGQGSPWKPAVYLVVTLPVALVREPAGPMVTTRITEYRHPDQPGTGEIWIQIGGHVLDTTHPLPDGSPAPVAGAWVQLETIPGAVVQRTSTTSLGRFTFERLQPAQYRLRTGATGLGEQVRIVTVPTETGEYDLRFP
jgi:hypothetical protein